VRVSVVLDGGHDEELRAASLASLEAQTVTDWEVVTSLAEATGEFVAFLEAADRWVPDRLERLLAVGAPAVADQVEGERGNGETVLLRSPAPDVEPARLLVRRDLLAHPDAIADPAWPFDLSLRGDLDVVALDRVGLRRRFPDRRRALTLRPGHHRNAVLARHIEWDSLAARTPTPGLTSVVVPTFEDAELTTACVESLLAGGDDVEVVVWDNGSSREVAEQLEPLGAHDRVTLVRSETNHGFALGNDYALRECHGDVVVFLNNDTTVPPRWTAPLRAALADPDVLGVQPLLLYPSGAVQCAGIAFPTCGGLPHAFLQGFPVEDAAGVDELEFAAVTGAALAVRWEDAVALQGFDATYTNGMEDVDLCLRLAALRPGHFRVVTDAPVVHHESRTPGRYDKHLVNRAVYLDRWQRVAEPRDDAALWATRGFAVAGHDLGRARHGEQPRLRVPAPVLVRERTTLRWAIKNPAPAGPGGARWGDTPFADALASALRDAGQEVVVDRRPEWDRLTARHDDVELVLRGLVRHDPGPTVVSLLWVISHPELVTPEEARGYDRVLAASLTWGVGDVPVTPLLQATDPDRFHPDAAEPDSGERVLFVGNSRRVLRPVVRDALEAGLPLAVYGDLWSGLVPDEVVRARSVPNAALAAAYAGAGVVLNDHHPGMRAAGFVSNRLFDAVASGARVVSDDVTGLRELFGDGVQVYRDADDLRRLATASDPDAVFGDLSARRAAAEWVRHAHSFAARAATLVDLALSARRERGLG